MYVSLSFVWVRADHCKPQESIFGGDKGKLETLRGAESYQNWPINLGRYMSRSAQGGDVEKENGVKGGEGVKGWGDG